LGVKNENCVGWYLSRIPKDLKPLKRAREYGSKQRARVGWLRLVCRQMLGGALRQRPIETVFIGKIE